MSNLRVASAALVVLAVLLLGLLTRRDVEAQAERAPRYQLTSTQQDAKGYRLFLVDSTTGAVWEYGSNFAEKSFQKLLDGPK